LLADRSIDRAATARLVIAMLARPGDELRAAAARLWRSLYGRELPPLERLGAAAAPSRRSDPR
jgi:hypothetical protein